MAIYRTPYLHLQNSVVNFAITKPRSEHPWLIARIPSFIADFCSEVFRKRKKMLNLKDIIVKKITFHLNIMKAGIGGHF
jgi:hypothetical protein